MGKKILFSFKCFLSFFPFSHFSHFLKWKLTDECIIPVFIENEFQLFAKPYEISM